MQAAARQFRTDGAPVSCERFGNGHINETYRLVTDRNAPYILQKINRHVFRDVQVLMRNIAAVTSHLATKEPDPRRVLTLVPTVTGGDCWTDDAGEVWRVYRFVERSVCLERAEHPAAFEESGVAFGRFQRMLSDFPAETLAETIPRFHDTPNRFRQLHSAIDADASGRVREARAEIDAALAYEDGAGFMTDLLRRGELPLRVTHNDTKLNNVLFDAETRAQLCVIDLDTVMPGLAANDFGDAIRFGASTAAEDERNLDRVRLSLPHYGAFARGFLGACGESLTPLELETLPYGAKLMTLENGIRFLADYLSGDVYYHTTREGQNLDRCRTQLRLLREFESHWAEMMRAVERYRT